MRYTMLLTVAALAVSATSASACGGLFQPKCQGPMFIPIPNKPVAAPKQPAPAVVLKPGTPGAPNAGMMNPGIGMNGGRIVASGAGN